MTTDTAAPLTDDADEPQWSGEELEAAYVRALEALDAVESEIVATAEEIAPGSMAAASTDVATSGVTSETVAPVADSTRVEPSVTARQVVEACLFVGGSALTAARLAGVLRGDYTAEYVEAVIDDLNRQYDAEARPYEIRLGEGGYRLAVRDEYERIRHKVYGLGPKEVRLSQEALEVLALVAYHQPATEEQLEALGRPLAGATLRLLLRRDLLTVDRLPNEPKAVAYRTTPRFLSLFGLGSLDDLPRPDDLLYK
ncbi:MAG: SMC-Scp complex subunit ScpB [Planctomycetaceae bacterium]|nr:SMC-Scp complex subunit ScpB [Planctomycetaceae bacterium]